GLVADRAGRDRPTARRAAASARGIRRGIPQPASRGRALGPLLEPWLEPHVRGDAPRPLPPTWISCVGQARTTALLLMLVLARRRGIDPGAVASVVVWGYAAAVVAGILVPAVIDGIEHLVATGQVHLRLSGMTSFWGYLAGAAAVALVCKRERLS